MSLFFPFYFLLLHLCDLRFKLLERAAGLNGWCPAHNQDSTPTCIKITVNMTERFRGNIEIVKLSGCSQIIKYSTHCLNLSLTNKLISLFAKKTLVILLSLLLLLFNRNNFIVTKMTHPIVMAILFSVEKQAQKQIILIRSRSLSEKWHLTISDTTENAEIRWGINIQLRAFYDQVILTFFSRFLECDQWAWHV